MRFEECWMGKDLPSSSSSRLVRSGLQWEPGRLELRVWLRHYGERDGTIGISSEGDRRACAKYFSFGFHLFSALSGVVASYPRREAKAAAAVRDQFRGQWTWQRKTSRRLSAHGAGGISREHIRGKFQTAALAHGGAEWRYFSCGYRSGRNYRAARPATFRRGAAARSFCERHEAAVRNRFPRRLRLCGKYERSRSLSLRSQNVEAPRRKGAPSGLAIGRT